MAESATRFRAPWSTLLSLITVFTVVLFIGWPFVLLVDGGRQALLPAFLIWVVTIGGLVWAFRTQFIRNYVLSGEYRTFKGILAPAHRERNPRKHPWGIPALPADGRCSLAAIVASPARRLSLPQRLVARRGNARSGQAAQAALG